MAQFSHIYTIRTEWSEEYQKQAEEIVGNRFESFNIVRGTGYWRGIREESMTIEIIGRADQRESVDAAAYFIALENDQEAVFVTMQQIEAKLVVGDADGEGEDSEYIPTNYFNDKGVVVRTL